MNGVEYIVPIIYETLYLFACETRPRISVKVLAQVHSYSHRPVASVDTAHVGGTCVMHALLRPGVAGFAVGHL
jgi:hypothetical protein